MAKRRTSQQIDADKIIRGQLIDLGEKIYEQAKERSRVAEDMYYLTDRVGPKGSLRKAGGTLRDSINFKPLSDTVLLVVQVDYGKYNYPKDDNSKRTYSGKDIVITEGMNALQQAIDDNVEDSVNIIVSEIMEKMTGSYDSK